MESFDILAKDRQKILRDLQRALVLKEDLATDREIRAEWLPPYAPDLNPEEFCHGNVKERIGTQGRSQ